MDIFARQLLAQLIALGAIQVFVPFRGTDQKVDIRLGVGIQCLYSVVERSFFPPSL
ncbi:MAG: hypothetical protein WDN72_07725 [Alphaproteobacteria bacterium]